MARSFDALNAVLPSPITSGPSTAISTALSVRRANPLDGTVTQPIRNRDATEQVQGFL